MSRERLGPPELIDYQLADGRIVKRWMRPVLDDQGNWLRWVPYGWVP